MAKGHLASKYPSDEGEYSDLQVLKSPGGYYIGTLFHYKEGWSEPGSRESEYFETKEEAEEALKNMSFKQRFHS